MILLDASNAYYISFAIAKREILNNEGREIFEDDLPFYFHILFNKLLKIFSTYGKVVICNEGEHSLEWRRSIFTDYKRNRDKSKQENSYKVFKYFMTKIDEVISLFPTKIMKVDYAEADDVIFALSEKYNQTENVIVISSDGDLTQIKNFYPTVEIYNPIKNLFVNSKPYIIESKALIGDPADGIPGVPRIGAKTFEKMMIDRVFFDEKIKGDNKEIYETFLKIVDLRKIPKNIKANIIEQESKLMYNKFDIDNIELFFFENRMKELLNNWGRKSGEILVKLGELE